MTSSNLAIDLASIILLELLDCRCEFTARNTVNYPDLSITKGLKTSLDVIYNRVLTIQHCRYGQRIGQGFRTCDTVNF